MTTATNSFAIRVFSFLVFSTLFLSKSWAQSSSHDGTTSTHYAIPNNSNLDITGDITIEAWLRPNAAQVNIGNVVMMGNYGYAFGIMPDGTIAWWNSGSQNSGPESTTGIAQDGSTWTHVAIAVDYNVGHTFYINGVAVGSNQQSAGASVYNNQSGQDLYIGRQGLCNCNFFNGLVDELRIWSDVRTAGEISANYNSTVANSEQGLAAYYRFNEGTGTTVFDEVTATAYSPSSNSITWSATDAGVASPDVTPPTFSNGPTIGTINSTDFNIQAGIDEASTLYYAVLLDGSSPAPSSSEVKTGGYVTSGSQNFNAFDELIIPVTGVQASTAYDVYIVAEDVSSNITTTPIQLDVTTLAPPQYALSFDGTGDIVTVANESNFDFETTDSFTIEAWVRTSTISSKIIAAKRDDAGGGSYPGYVLWTSANVISVIIEGTGGNRIYVQASNDNSTGISVSTNTWTHLAFTYDGSETAAGVSLFIDGVETLANIIAEDNLSGSMLNNQSFEIGRQSVLGSGWVGEIDEVRVWDFARNPSDIAANYDNELTGNEPNLVTYHDFVTGSGSSSLDVTTFNDGTITDAVWSTVGPAIDNAPEINVYGLSVTPGTTDADVTIVSQTQSDLYYVITTSNQQPSSAQILAGQDHTGASAYNYQNYGSITGLANFSVGNTSFTNGNNLVQGTTYYIYWIGDDDGVDGGNQSEIVSTSFTTLTPSDITFTSQALTGSTDLYPGSTGNIIYSMQMDVATADATTQGFLFFLGGSFNSGTDFVTNGFELWSSTTNDFGTALSIGTSSYNPTENPGNGDLAFVFGNTYNAGTTTYFWITADLAAGASPNNFNVNTPNASSNFFFTTTPNYTPSLSTGNTYNIIDTNVENALTFDGVNDFVDISDVKLVDDAVDDYTFSLWFNANTIEDYENLIAYSNFDESSAEPFTGLSFFSGGIRFAKRNDAGGEFLTIDGPSIQSGQWYHVAITKSGSNYVLYVNGQPEQQTTFASAAAHTRTTVLVGATSAGNSSREQVTGYFDGLIDEVKLWNDARTASEIQADMYEKYPSTSDNLEAYYSFDQSGGDRVLDQSPNGHDGQLFGEFAVVASSTANSVTSQANIDGTGSVLAYGLSDDMAGSLIRISDDDPVVKEDRIIATNTNNTAFTSQTNTFTVTENWTINPAANSPFFISYNNPTFGTSGAFTPVAYLPTNSSTVGTTINWESFTGTGDILVDINTQSDFAGTALATAQSLGDPSTGSMMVNTTLTANTEYFVRLSYQDGAYTSSYSETISFYVDPGYALDFDGTDDEVVAGAVPLANSSFTLEAWAKRRNTASTNRDYLFGMGSNATNNGLQVGFVESDEFYVSFYNNGAATTSTYTDTDWHHWAVTYDVNTNQLLMYQDGVEIGDFTMTGDFTGSGSLHIGNSYSGNGNIYDGEIDEVRVWNYVKSDVDLQANLYETLSGSESGLLAYYRFDENTGTDLPDLSGNGYDGVWGGAASGTNTSPNWVTSTALQSTNLPSTPSDFVAYRASSTEVTFAWTDNANDETSFTIESADDFGFTANLQPVTTVSANTTSTTFSVGANTDKFYRVYASNGTGDGGASDVAFASTENYPGQALDFSSSSDRVIISNVAAFGGNLITVEAWINTTTTTDFSRIMSSGESGGQRWSLNVNGVGWGFPLGKAVATAQFSGGNVFAASSTDVNDGLWHHVAGVYDLDNATVSIYVDGVLESTNSGSGTPSFNGDNINIGNFYTGFNTSLRGDLDEVRVWSTLKTDFSDRFAPIDVTSSANTANLIGYLYL